MSHDGSGLLAYGCNASGPAIELGPVTPAGAQALIAERFAFADIPFQTVEDAIAKTMFGFYRSERDFLEINLASSTLITVRHEPVRDGFFRKLFGGREYLIELNSRDELERIVDAYTRNTADAFALMQRHPNKA